MNLIHHPHPSPRAAMFRVPGATALALAVLLGVGAATPAAAQTACRARGEAVAHLQKQYSEVPVSMGLASNGTMIEVFSSPGGATWSIVMTLPDGRSCLVDAGEAWENLLEPVPGKPA